MNRPLPAGCDAFLRLAEEAGLDCPLGRALYCANRARNTWPVVSRKNGAHRKTPLAVMRDARLSTAERWLAHWRLGGSIYGLCYLSDFERLSDKDKRKYGEAEMIRRAVKRIRTGKHLPLPIQEVQP